MEKKNNKSPEIPIIDLFAGPGGLGEGFSAYKRKGCSPFKIKLSVEKDHRAWQTLSLRAFFRQFKTAPDEYYDYTRGVINRNTLTDKFPNEWKAAKAEAWEAELGLPETNRALHEKIDLLIDKEKPWILVGGPPCQAYSLVGRSRNSGNKQFENDPRHFLYKQYLEVIAKHWPSVFIMENVKGILSSKTNGQYIFPKIHDDLSSPIKAINQNNKNDNYEYEIFSLVKNEARSKINGKDFIIQMENHGIPQSRHRVILFGIRNDLIPSGYKPATLEHGRHVPITKVLTLPPLRSVLSVRASKKDSWKNWRDIICSTADSSWISDIDSDIRELILKTVKQFSSRKSELNTVAVTKNKPSKYESNWFYDPKIGLPLNHETRGHMDSDLHRYLFAACFTKIFGKSPKIENFPSGLLPKHKNIKSKRKEEWVFGDRFRVQNKNKPATTITSHISKDGHYYIHPDPAQCRSLTVREAARIQTFPDNYFFCGPRTSQYHQVGNAVPPLLAKQIAGVVWDFLKDVR